MTREPTPENRAESLEGQRFVNEVASSITETYPFDDPQEKDAFAKRIRTLADTLPSNQSQILEELKKILATLENTHLFIGEKVENAHYFVLDQHIYYKADEFWVDRDGTPMRVVGINGKPIMDIINKRLEAVGGGTMDWKVDTALRRLMVSENSDPMSLEVDNQGTREVIEASFNPIDVNEKIDIKKFISSEILEGNLGYLRISSWSSKVQMDGRNIADFVDDELEALRSVSGLIIDVRDNSGGDSSLAYRLAGRFLDEQQVYASAFVKGEDSDEFKKEEFTVDPLEPRIDKPVVILTGPRCLSSNELFILMLKDTGHAITVGETTGGGSGNPKTFSLRLGEKEYNLNVPRWRLIRNDGQKLENIGIEPDAEIKMTIQDVIENKDPAIEKAVDYLR